MTVRPSPLKCPAPVPMITDVYPPLDTSRPDLDIILRSSDKNPVDFRVSRLFLAPASPFFASLFALPQPPQDSAEMKDGVPVIPISENSITIERLLPFCYPRYTPLPHFDTLEEVQAVLEMAAKYDMKGAEKCLGGILVDPRFVEREPMRVFAIACRYGLESEARIAAKHTLRLSLSERHYVAEMEHITAGTLQRLLDYYFQCSQAASAVARDFHWISKDSFSWFARESCSCGGSNHVLISHGSINLPARVWWLNYMRQLSHALSERPSVSTVRGKELMEDVLDKTKSCACGRKTILDMFEFRESLAQEVEKRISGIELVLTV